MKTIPLTQGKVAIVDKKYHNYCKWNCCFNGNTFYVARTKNRSTIYMHRVIMERMLGRKLRKGEYVDHKNRNGLDNRECNLRLCTQSQNNANTKINKRNKSGCRGVSFNKEKQKWRVQIQREHLGYFSNLEEAAKTYDEKAIELFGEFAVLNFEKTL